KPRRCLGFGIGGCRGEQNQRDGELSHGAFEYSVFVVYRPAMAYAALDYYALDELYTHEERMARDTVRELVSSRIMPTIGKHFSAGTFPHELVPVFGEMGLLGPSLSGYGCAGISPTAYGLICQELERGDSGIRSFVSVQSSLVMYPIWAYGSEEQKQKWLPEMAAGRAIGCFGLTEPDFGSNPN